MGETISVDTCLAMLFEMIEEAQREANHCLNHADRQLILSKRDALTELRMRLRGNQIDPYWVRRLSC